jgi:hypothetical protein
MVTHSVPENRLLDPTHPFQRTDLDLARERFDKVS